MRTVVIVAVVLALLGLALVVVGRSVSEPIFDEPLRVAPQAAYEILPVDQALTLARTTEGRVLLVTGATADAVDGVYVGDILQTNESNVLAVLQQFGYSRLAALADEPTDTLPMEQLGLPFAPAYPHIAAGTNFRAHAEEVGLDDGPFLFPKLSHATAWNASVAERARLDYEAELCAVTLAAYSIAAPAPLGFVLCNDFTDRWSLLVEIDLDTAMGQSGFPDAKGGAGMLPVGPFLVVPANDRAFHGALQIGLGVNGRLRQRDSAGLMIWTPHEIAAAALEQCETPFVSTAGEHLLTPCGAIPEATLLLTGTPAGVMFNFLNIWRPASYLRAGDEVLTYGHHLGVLRNNID